ncbi:PLAT domain-containing protein 2-like [Mercurialis annua]|uniref:PLAT domain-containing protein 2-like n=1 Tax=Mercurialis annua TaxID=3986 RepID=UPI0021605C67|nr:PLAT domain-containing protein 2-like [Mercurialis annua]
MAAASYVLAFLLLLAFSGVVLSESCTYSIAIKTGSKRAAGTNAKVSLKFSNLEDPPINLQNIAKYGSNGPGYDYFENDYLDHFKYTGLCFTFPVCYIKLSHDNGGYKPGWYVNYVDIYASGSSITPTGKRFDVYQWLAFDEAPYEISTIRDLCVDELKSVGGIESVVNGTI